MIQNVFGLFIHPTRQWQKIRGEDSSLFKLYAGHILILAAIPALCAYIGTTQVGWQFGNRAPDTLTATSALQLSVLAYLAMLVGVAIMGGFVHWMSRTYDATPSFAQCVSFAAYTASPLFLAGLSGLYPQVWFTTLIGMAAICYSVYLLYVGLPTFMNIPEDEGFLFSTSVLAVALVVLVGMMTASVILWGLGIGPVYTN